MNIQSLSVLVPTKGCVNKCKFCVSRMHENDYDSPCDNLDKSEQFLKRLQFARDNNCNTVMLTGTGEVLQNKVFLKYFSNMNKLLPNSFKWIELQTSGVMLTDENLEFLRDVVKVDTISLSLSDIFHDDKNSEICGITEKLRFKIENVCRKIKEYGFNLRLSLNMSNVYDNWTPSSILRHAKKLGADQVTFRKLYSSGQDQEIDKWVEENKMNETTFSWITAHIVLHGKALEILPFGAVKYSYDGMGVVVDGDCMAENVSVVDTYKYLILRQNNRLYSKWDDHGSLIF